MKKNIKLFIVLFLFLFLVCFQLCLAQETQTQTPAEPINVSGKNFPFIDCIGIKILIPKGTVLGNSYVIPEKFTPQEQDAIINTLLPELEKAGYSIPKPSLLFGPDESRKPRFVIAGGLSKWSFYYLPKSSTKEASVEIQWEVYDNISKKVIYQATTDGYIRLNVTAKEHPTNESMRISFRKFLSNPNLVSAIQNCIVPSASAESAKLNVVYYTINKDLETSPDKIKEAMKSSFTIKLEKAYGTGFIINPEGYALTNYHVVKNISSFDAVFSDGKTIRGVIIKTFSDKDLALVKLSGSGYPYLPLKLTSALKMGEDVFSIGTPASLELSQIVSKGIVNAINNDFKLGEGKSVIVIQTDASINAGNSGGPLVDSKGFAVGVNSFGLTPEKGFEGLKFAISIDEAIKEFGLTEAQH